MSEYIKVEGNSNLVRDAHSSAIINRNRNAYELAKKKSCRSTKTKR